MDYAVVLTDLAQELLEYGEYETDSSSYLYKQCFKAARYIDDKYQWNHQITPATLTTTQGTYGPYDVESDFKGMVNEERVNYAYAYDDLSVPVIPDGEAQIQYPVHYRRATNKLYFEFDPGNGTYTFYYRKKLAALTDLSGWKQDLDLALKELTKYFVLNNSEDTKQSAALQLQTAEKLIRAAWASERKGHTMQQTVEPRDVYGDAFYQSHLAYDE